MVDEGQNFYANNNQSTPADVTGLLFSNMTAFKINISVFINATVSLAEYFVLDGVKVDTDW